MYVLVRAANPFIGTTVGVAVCLLIVAFLMAVATGKAKRRRRADTTPGECLRHHHSSSGATGLPGPQVGFRRLGVSPQWRFFFNPTCRQSLDKNSPYRRSTRSSAIAEGPRDASCPLKSCQLPHNSAETTYTTSPDQIDGIKLEI